VKQPTTKKWMYRINAIHGSYTVYDSPANYDSETTAKSAGGQYISNKKWNRSDYTVLAYEEGKVPAKIEKPDIDPPWEPGDKVKTKETFGFVKAYSEKGEWTNLMLAPYSFTVEKGPINIGGQNYYKDSSGYWFKGL
jgi:hypothetical protein